MKRFLPLHKIRDGDAAAAAGEERRVEEEERLDIADEEQLQVLRRYAPQDDNS